LALLGRMLRRDGVSLFIAGLLSAAPPYVTSLTYAHDVKLLANLVADAALVYARMEIDARDLCSRHYECRIHNFISSILSYFKVFERDGHYDERSFKERKLTLDVKAPSIEE
jgi:hypothetical protein